MNWPVKNKRTLTPDFSRASRSDRRENAKASAEGLTLVEGREIHTELQTNLNPEPLGQPDRPSNF